MWFMWQLLLVLLLFINSIFAKETKCESLEGKWYNQHGSELILVKDEQGHFIGEYRTAVERINGSAGWSYAPVKGVALNLKTRSVLGFTVLFNHGKSVASWLGRCRNENNEETLETTWLLRKQVESHNDHWKATLINSDVFKRTEFGESKRNKYAYELGRTSHLIRTDLNRSRLDEKDEEIKRVVKSMKILEGKWHGNSGAEMELLVDAYGNITGTYFESDMTTIRKQHKIRGFIDPNNINGVFGLYSLQEEKIITIWVGQRHIEDKQQDHLQMAFLYHKNDENCRPGWNAVSFGTETFTRKIFSGKSERDLKSSSMYSYITEQITGFFKRIFGSK